MLKQIWFYSTHSYINIVNIHYRPTKSIPLQIKYHTIIYMKKIVIKIALIRIFYNHGNMQGNENDFLKSDSNSILWSWLWTKVVFKFFTNTKLKMVINIYFFRPSIFSARLNCFNYLSNSINCEKFFVFLLISIHASSADEVWNWPK